LEALWEARATHHDTLAARAWIALVMAVGAVSGRSTEAQELARHAEAAIERVGNKPELSAELAYSLGWVHLEARRWHDAVEQFERALGLLESLYGPAHYRVANALGSLGRAFAETDALDEALAVQERAVRLWSQLLGDHHLNVAMGRTEIARTLLRLGRHSDALRQSQAAVALFGELGASHPAEGFAWMIRGEVETELCRYDDANRSLERAVGLVEGLLGSDHRYLIEPLTAAGRLAVRQGHTKQAVERFQRALAIARRGDSDDSMQASLATELERVTER
jgi:tetratricopeptide (TPR) repeat protein